MLVAYTYTNLFWQIETLIWWQNYQNEGKKINQNSASIFKTLMKHS